MHSGELRGGGRVAIRDAGCEQQTEEQAVARDARGRSYGGEDDGAESSRLGDDHASAVRTAGRGDWGLRQARSRLRSRPSSAHAIPPEPSPRTPHRHPGARARREAVQARPACPHVATDAPQCGDPDPHRDGRNEKPGTWRSRLRRRRGAQRPPGGGNGRPGNQPQSGAPGGEPPRDHQARRDERGGAERTGAICSVPCQVVDCDSVPSGKPTTGLR